MNLFAISGLSVSIFCVALATISLIYGKGKIRYLLTEFNVVVGIWGIGIFLVGSAATESAALFGWKFGHVGGLLIGVVFYHLVCVFCGLQRRRRIIFVYLQGLFFLYFIIFTDYLINKTRFIFGLHYNQANWFYYVFLGIWLTIVCSAFYELFHFFKRAQGDKRRQTLYMLFGFLTGFTGGISSLLPQLGIDILPYGNFTIPIYSIIITYAILKHRLMDIKVGFSRVSIYGMILILVAGIPLGMLFMNTFAVAGLSLGIACLLLAFIVLSYGKTKLHRIWAIFNITVAIWGLGTFFAAISKTPIHALLSWRFSYSGGIFISVLFYHTVCTFCNLQRKRSIIFAYAQGFFFLLLDLATNYFIYPLEYLFGSFYYNKATFAYYVWFIIWSSIVLVAFYELFKFMKRSKGIQHTQALYLFLGMALGFAGGTSTVAPSFGILIYPAWHFTICIYTALMTYAILKYRLMDIRIVVTRAGVFGVVYALVLGIPFSLFFLGKPFLFNLVGENWTLIPLISAILLATVGPFIYLYLQRRAEEIVRREQLEYQGKLRTASSTIMLNKDLDKLLKVMVLNAVDIVKVEWSGIYLKDEKQSKYLLRHYRSKAIKIDLPKEFADNSDFVERLYKSRLPLIGEEISFQELKVGLAVPCFIDNNMIGFLLLGNKPNDKIYDQSDVNEFALLANQAALAIENCQFYSQERQHQQYLRVASLDRQMADLAHEIDNPNSALLSSLGSLELSLDDLKDVIPADKMEYFKKKIERARFNSKRISKMITSVREFSRPSTGEIKPIKFEWVMEGFLNIIEPQFKYNGINFIKEVPDEIIWLRANKVELEQVLVNLGTNSVQAINEIWQRGENTPDSKKDISLKVHKIDSNIIRIDFSDTGSGIAKETLEQIFLDFVTTKGSAQGTGLGLSISRKIIQKHGGKIWVESEGENKGATFHIELPIANNLTEEEKKQAEAERGEQGKKDMFIQDFPK